MTAYECIHTLKIKYECIYKETKKREYQSLCAIKLDVSVCMDIQQILRSDGFLKGKDGLIL